MPLDLGVTMSVMIALRGSRYNNMLMDAAAD